MSITIIICVISVKNPEFDAKYWAEKYQLTDRERKHLHEEACRLDDENNYVYHFRYSGSILFFVGFLSLHSTPSQSSFPPHSTHLLLSPSFHILQMIFDHPDASQAIQIDKQISHHIT